MALIIISLIQFRRQVAELPSPGKLYSKLMDLIVRFAHAGLIHGDFNEFNILVRRQSGEPVVIDFPQMVSTSHENAEWYARLSGAQPVPHLNQGTSIATSSAYGRSSVANSSTRAYSIPSLVAPSKRPRPMKNSDLMLWWLQVGLGKKI